MTLTVGSNDGRIEVFHDSDFKNDIAFISVPSAFDVVQQISIKHSDIDAVIETLQLYKDRMTEVMGESALM